jgi:uncharacterized metal-binding protein YceD (DUF177 family)
MKALMSDSPRKPVPPQRRDTYPWSVPLRFEDVLPETGRQVALSPDAHAREAIAAVAGLRELLRLDASFDVVRSGAADLHVTGTVSATVGQTCVVTLEPIEREINEAIDLVFKQAADNSASAGIGLDMDRPEIEPLIDGVVDLATLATEFLILGIDPYPRKPGAAFEAPSTSEPFAGPFAGLAALQKKPQK